MQRSERATTTMDTVNSDIRLSLDHMSAVESSLSALTRRGQSDVEAAFKVYSNNVEKLEKHGTQWMENADDMNKRGRQYFAEWAKQDGDYANPRIQSVSEQRRADLGMVYDEIIVASLGVNDAMLAYMSDHQQMQSFLSNDLTTKGIEAISPLVPQIREDGRDLTVALKRVRSAIDGANAEMVHAGAR